MPTYHHLAKFIIPALLLALSWSCAPAPLKPPEASYYVTSEITYLKDRPGPGGNVVGPLYRGDQVETLGVGESNWLQVKLDRSGQTGWVQRELLSPDPVATVFYYVRREDTPLLDCPRPDCVPLQMLFRGEKVQRVEEGEQGWWRVLVLKSRSLGWVRGESLTENIEETRRQVSQIPYYYVAVKKLILRAIPSNHGAAVRNLGFNDQVQKIGEAPGWFRVRQPASGALGWVPSRDLETLPQLYPRGIPAREKIKPFKQREQPLVEPEFM